MKTAEQMMQQFHELYDLMAASNKVAYMQTFGNVHKEMMEWFIQNKPELAEEWLCKLESIRWKNYLTPKEAEKIVGNMEPSAPWSKEQWRNAIAGHGFELENVPYYNQCALWVTMEMIMSDSSETINKYVGNGDKFAFVYDLAVDKLTDADGVFSIRKYFSV